MVEKPNIILVFTDQHRLDAQLLDQDFPNEALRVPIGKLPVEGQAEDTVDAAAFHQFDTVLEVRDQPGCTVRVQDFQGVGEEGDDERGPAVRLRLLPEDAEDLLVATMDSVKVPQRYHRIGKRLAALFQIVIHLHNIRKYKGKGLCCQQGGFSSGRGFSDKSPSFLKRFAGIGKSSLPRNPMQRRRAHRG